VSETELSATLTASDLAVAGTTLSVTIATPAAAGLGGGESVVRLVGVGPVAAQVRFVNGLVVCAPACVDFTAQLTAAQGYSWSSRTSVGSPYQTVTHTTLSSFSADAVGFGPIGSCTCPFSLTPGRRYRLQLGIANGAIKLSLVDEGAMTLGEPSAVDESVTAEGTLSGSPPTLRFAPH
jgi:hypothetical protein